MSRNGFGLQTGIWIGPSLFGIDPFVEMLVVIGGLGGNAETVMYELQAGGGCIIRTLSAGSGTGLDVVACRVGRAYHWENRCQDNKSGRKA